MTPLLTLALVVMVSGLAALCTPLLLTRLAEPELEPGEEKLPYRDLPAVPLAVAAGTWAGTLGAVVVLLLPPHQWAPWLLVAAVGAVGCAIDAATTWLPRRILHVGWVTVAVALLATTVVTGDWLALLRAVAGAGVVGGLLLVAHLLGGFGFSDVRLGLLTGAVSAWVSWQTLAGGLVLGSLVGAVWGVVHAISHGARSPFPYGPAILFGPYLALLVPAVMQRLVG